MDIILITGFKIPVLVNLNTKSKQLAALQKVRESYSTEYKELEEEESILNKKFCALLKSTNRGAVSLTKGKPTDKNNTTLKWAPPQPKYRTSKIYLQR